MTESNAEFAQRMRLKRLMRAGAGFEGVRTLRDYAALLDLPVTPGPWLDQPIDEMSEYRLPISTHAKAASFGVPPPVYLEGV